MKYFVTVRNRETDVEIGGGSYAGSPDAAAFFFVYTEPTIITDEEAHSLDVDFGSEECSIMELESRFPRLEISVEEAK